MRNLPLAACLAVIATTIPFTACMSSSGTRTDVAPAQVQSVVPPATTAVTSAALPSSVGPVVFMAFENHPTSSVVGSPYMPYLNGLMNQYAVATNLVEAGTGSVPDYFMVTVGDIVSNSTGYAGPYTGNNLARVLIGGNRPWKVYVQGIPAPGYVGTGVYPYVKYHNPFAYFSDVLDGGPQQNNIVPLSQLAIDISSGTLPDFMFIVPDNQHNAHDCPPGLTTCTDADALGAVDQFLQTYVPGIMSNASFQQSGLLVVWWDEGNATTPQTALTFVGPQVIPGYKSAVLYHDEDLLRTMIDILGLTSYPGASATATDMTEFFTAGTVYTADTQHRGAIR